MMKLLTFDETVTNSWSTRLRVHEDAVTHQIHRSVRRFIRLYNHQYRRIYTHLELEVN